MAMTTKCSPQTMVSFCPRQSLSRLLFGVWLFLLTRPGSLLLPPSHDHKQLLLRFTLVHKAPGQCAHGPGYPRLFIKSWSRIKDPAETVGQKPQAWVPWYRSPVKLLEKLFWMCLPIVTFFFFLKPTHSPNIRAYLNIFHDLSLRQRS